MSHSDSSGTHEPKAHLEIYSEPIGDDYKEREIRYGREYPQKHGDRHPWPIDEYEESRQPVRLQELEQWGHQFSITTRTGNVLDLRTGFGLWAMHFADKNPGCRVFGVDFVYMQPWEVPLNCDFHIIDLTQPDWWEIYVDISLVHINDLGGDISLLKCLLAGAFRCCMPCGVVELHGITLDLYNRKGPAYSFYKDLQTAYYKDERQLSLPERYGSELSNHGFINVASHQYRIPLKSEYSTHLQKRFLKTWLDGLEALALDLMTKHLGWTRERTLLECALAREELHNGTDGFLTM
ncbi:uncharacterized protein AKAW2_31499A [Aspergillus luchuensis]|uniref:Methyltransferase domain-containing protein n=1 Tax=Aspergillus kawachii TaxID=1069201 RepID=A0A7R7ZXK4_ASPKA|nr:uncharacterized protein AKAW2_31499A [Aspergillus luchuensis]BCR98180.1 hypothetical protein AKAW2_31499A [Aspergillus luchuensis]